MKLIDNKMILLFVIAVAIAQAQEFLNNVPILFALEGDQSYMPSAGGGIPVAGYSIKIGFDRFSWLGIQFRTLTSTNNYDTMILQRSSTPSAGVYACTVSDYYISSGRPTTLMSDTMTSMDYTTTSSSNTSSYSLTFPRTKGNTNGEDWQGGQFVSICFFTSDAIFNQNAWSRQYQVCYGYEVNNYVSTYRGQYLGNMPFEGVDSQVYGGIQGPWLELRLHWYRSSVAISNSSEIIIRLGDQISSDLGYDHHVCGVGDYYGFDSGNLHKDLLYSGYDNGACTFSIKTQSVMMSYKRDLFTFDSFDKTVGQTFSVCLIGIQSHCQTFTLPLNYAIMSVYSALTIFESFHFNINLILLLLLLCVVSM